MKQQDLRKATVKGMIWNYASHYLGKLLLFLTTVVLARVLLQEDFGLAGYALTIVGLIDVISDLGIGTAIIYFKDEPAAKNTAFWLALLVGLVLGGLTYLGAPLVGVFFNDVRAVELSQAMALFFPLSALKVVPEALLRKGLTFGRKMIPDLLQTASKGAFSIGLALMGMGAWSLILGQLAGTLISVIAYWWVCPWRPALTLDRNWVAPMLRYGLGIVGVNLLAAIVLNADYLLVGRYLGATALGIYTIAFRIPELIILQFCSVLSKVLLPVYARLRDEGDGITRGFLLTTRYVSIATVPLGFGLALLAEPFVLFTFGERWGAAVPVMQAISIYALLLSLGYHAGDVYKAQGSPNLVSALILVRLGVLLPLLWWAISGPGTIEAVAWAQVIVALVGTSANLLVAARRLRLQPVAILRELWLAFTAGAVMSAAVAGLVYIGGGLPPLALLIAGALLGALVYAAMLWLLQRELIVQTGKLLRETLVRGAS